MPLTGGIDHRDSGVFAHGGWVVASGGTPYIDFWDQKPPAIFLMNAFAIKLFEMKLVGAWWLSLSSLLISLFLAYLVLSRWLGKSIAALLSLFYAVSFAGVLQGGNTVELYALVCEWLLWLLAIQWVDSFSMEKRGTPYRILLALLGGGLAGILHALRQNEAAIAVAVFIALIWNEIAEKRGKNVLMLFASGILGKAIVWVPLLLWLGSRGALTQFYDQAYTYNFHHKIAATALMRLDAFGAIFDYLPVFAIAIVGWFLLVRRKIREGIHFGMRERILSLALPFGLLAVLASGQRFPHYFITLMPTSILFAGLLISKPILLWAKDSPRVDRAIRVSLVLLAVVTFAKTPNNVWNKLDSERGIVEEQTAAMLDSWAVTGDRLFVWGMVPELYVESGLTPATGYTHVYPLISPGYTDSSVVQNFMDDLSRDLPRFILDASSHNGRVPSLGVWTGMNRGVVLAPALKDFFDLVETEYEPLDTTEQWDWILYVRKKGVVTHTEAY